MLAFTCSRHRPLMLRHCIMQLQHQTYPADHVVYVNSSENSYPDETTLQYDLLLDDLRGASTARIKIAYGPSMSSHKNYLAALRLAEVDDYDLFLKIDDDDIYLRDYVKGVVRDFCARRWDYSGSVSTGLLNGHRWKPKAMLTDLGLEQADRDMGIPGVMPPSAAFSRRAVQALLEIPDVRCFEDIVWRRHLAVVPQISMVSRKDRNFVYNIHGGNVSTSHLLQA